jgi:hypothetical protein
MASHRFDSIFCQRHGDVRVSTKRSDDMKALLEYFKNSRSLKCGTSSPHTFSALMM